MVLELWHEFFARPILEYSGYNVVNTLVYGAVLLGVAFGLVYPFFKKRGINFDYGFFKAVLPYIILGSTFRIFEEANSSVFFFQRSANPLELGFYMVSPGIYVLMGVLAIISLYASLRLAPKIGMNPLRMFGLAGWVAVLPVVFFQLLHLTRPIEFLFVWVAVGVIVAGLYHAFRLLKKNVLKERLNVAALAAQATDGVATFTALGFFSSYSEQHVVSNFIIQNFSPAAFVVVKVALALLILYFVDKEIESSSLRNFIKIFIIILGFAPGIRDAFSLGLTTLG